ncbi:MATE family efflux transporter [Cohaesibacter haloalkalitolerans]|uniref:MATE family efflux transporter n=1 Tax=Cohaesibacter haloalkalitolerans TaxID=1162980 RepID=UPI0013C42706|nr:MATE family efflux transporter [Cohaesibacter haloalkalitolerans]
MPVSPLPKPVLLDRETPSILKLAGFLSLSGLFSTSAILIDANMVGPIGDETLAGLGLCAGLYGVFMALLFGLGSGAQILLTRAFGVGDMRLFYRRLLRMLALGLGMSFILVLLFRFNINFLVDRLATTSGIGFAAKRYLELMVYAPPLSFAAYLLTISFDVKRQAPRELKGFAIELPLNIILNALLIYGWFGAPELGIKGAAIATLISQSARLVYLVGLLAGDMRAAYALPVPKSSGLAPSARTNPDHQGQAEEPLLPRHVLVPVTLNVAALIVGAQAYQLLFAQQPYLTFAALALMTPWLSVANVLGRSVAMSATLTCADLKPGSETLRQAIGSVLKALRYLAPRLALLFVGVTLVADALSWHISDWVRINFLLLIPYGGVLVLVRTVSVTIGAILRATDRPKWVFWVQVGLQWGFGVPLLMIVTHVFELSLYIAYGILILEELLRLAIMWLRLRRLMRPQVSAP